MPSNSIFSNGKLDCLYYPFSRLLDAATLKYLLLTFDSVSFLDESNSAWRRHLLEEMQRTSPVFGKFEELADDYGMLEEEGALRIVNPYGLAAPKSDVVAMSILADLDDRDLMRLASHPERYNLPAIPFHPDLAGGQPQPTWQLFEGKIPKALLGDGDAEMAEKWKPHVLLRGDEYQSWSLTYAAGSVCATNYYLEAAQELGLAPITSSRLHHQIVLDKLKRMAGDSSEADRILDGEIVSRCRAALSHGEILRLIEGIFPAEQLERLTFAQIVRFRQETAPQRRAFLDEVSETVRVLEGDPSRSAYDRQVAVAVQDLRNKMRSVQKDLASVRDKLLPSTTDAVLYGAAGTGAVGSLGTFLGGLSTAGLVAASALTIGGALTAKASQIWLERRQVLKRQTAGVSYLLAIDRLRK